MCRSVVHHNQVNEGKLPKDTLKHAETITKATMKTKVLEAPLDPSKFELDDPNIYLVPAIMRDVLDITMNENIDRYDARVAASFQFKAGKADLAERMAYIDNLSADDIATITQWEKEVNEYGVEESIKWKCKTCGHVHTDELELEAHSFFPSAA
jgi:rubrerythrin